MKATFERVELDGAKDEIAAVLSQIITARTPQLQSPTDEHLGALADEIIAADVEEMSDEEEFEPVSGFGVTRADRAVPSHEDRAAAARKNLERVAYEIADEESAKTAYPPVPKWQDIPTEQRRWSSRQKNTLHLRHPDHADKARCGETALAPEDTVLEYPQATSIAKVCGTCWRRSVEAGRK